jgi:DNA-binding response OmpR family regulator
MKKITAIIVEDEFIAAEFLSEILEEMDVDVLDVIDTGAEAIKKCTNEQPDIIFMDVMLHDNISGCEAAVAIHKKNTHSKIIFLTAYVDEEMIDYAAQAEAVGYLTKPYNKAQIMATLKLATMTKKSPIPVPEKQEEEDVVKLKNGYIYIRSLNRLIKRDKEVQLGPTALKLIELLCRHVGISVSNEQISLHVWGEIVNDKTLRSLMYRIRTATDSELIKNISGTGYMIQPIDKD